jgi:hypothetical protein
MNTKTINIALSVLKIAIILIGVISLLMVISNADASSEKIGSLVNPALYVVYFAAILGGLTAVGFGLYFIATNVKKSIPVLAGILGFILIAIISYSSSSNEVLRAYGDGITEGISQYAGAGVIMIYVLGTVAVLSIIWAEVSKIFK